MNNKEIYVNIFKDVFSIEEESLVGLKYQDIEAWDSVGHMTLIAELEDAFDVAMETDDIIDFSGYEKGMELLGKYGIQF